MKSEFRTFDYFKSALIDPFFLIGEILGDESNPQYTNIKFDLENIDNEKLQKYVEEKNIDMFLGRFEDKDSERRKFYLIDKIQIDISAARIEILLDNTTNAAPYNSKNLSNLAILENNLVSARDFISYDNNFLYNDFVYMLSPTIDASNSSYWISSIISRLIASKNLNFKIRLDPFIECHYNDFQKMVYKMNIYGRELDWNRLKYIKDDEHGRWMDEKSYSRTKFTDYVWRPGKSEIHFTCEELPKKEYLKERGSRYFHAIFDKETGTINHCDGAIRIYDAEEFEKRLNFHVRNAEVRKIGKRIKIFQIDESINQDDFQLLITNFMVWNEDVFDYFNA